MAIISGSFIVYVDSYVYFSINKYGKTPIRNLLESVFIYLIKSLNRKFIHASWSNWRNITSRYTSKKVPGVAIPKHIIFFIVVVVDAFIVFPQKVCRIL